MARRRSSHGSTGRVTGRRTMTPARRSAAAKTYWRTVKTIARRLDKPIKDARAIVREGRARELTHTELRKTSSRRAGALLRSDRAKAPARFRLKRERDTAVEFPFGANVMPAPTERAEVQRTAPEPDDMTIDDLDDFIEEYEDADDYDEIDVEVTPSYKGRGK
jgi:hypothetical protein